MCNLSLNKNSFGLICAPFSEIRENIALFPMKNNMNNADRQPPSNPFIINAVLQFENKTLNIKLIMNISVLYIENYKLVGKPFVDFFEKNQGQDYNKKIYTYPNYDNEDDVKNALEKINTYYEFQSKFWNIFRVVRAKCLDKNGDDKLKIKFLNFKRKIKVR